MRAERQPPATPITSFGHKAAVTPHPAGGGSDLLEHVNGVDLHLNRPQVDILFIGLRQTKLQHLA